ncbi:YbhB/YbcL family Raf kinase inhibitor-like protein [Kitasatospora sp. McL0602]|uniref:YbhB/YbcL family Raf kinase inhibitor-like protein n=1 Tax=Kitasatospora sp. McL0602 TaxID=3439530 RepID=UPI003F8CCCE2
MSTFSPNRSRARHALLSAAALAAALCLSGAASPVGVASPVSAGTLAGAGAVAAPQGTLKPFTLTSPDFRDGGRLPLWSEFGGTYGDDAGCHGKNLAPQLDWRNAPAGTQSYALLVNDPDAPIAGGWHHWVVYDIPGASHRLDGHGATQYTQGASSWDTHGLPVVGWGGPCPPPTGQTHHYVFTLYALSATALPAAGLTYEQATDAIRPYVLGSTVIVGTFKLPR